MLPKTVKSLPMIIPIVPCSRVCNKSFAFPLLQLSPEPPMLTTVEGVPGNDYSRSLAVIWKGTRVKVWVDGPQKGVSPRQPYLYGLLLTPLNQALKMNARTVKQLRRSKCAFYCCKFIVVECLISSD